MVVLTKVRFQVPPACGGELAWGPKQNTDFVPFTVYKYLMASERDRQPSPNHQFYRVSSRSL